MRFYNEFAREQVEKYGNEAACLAKIEGYAARLSLVVHFIRWAGGDPTIGDPLRLDERTIAAGVSLSRWFGREALRVYGMLAEDDEARDRRTLVEWIVARGGEATARDLCRGPRRFRDNPELAQRALADLVAAGLATWVRDDPADRGGRPTDRVRIIRGGTGDETPQKPPESRSFVAVANVAGGEETPDRAAVLRQAADVIDSHNGKADGRIVA